MRDLVLDVMVVVARTVARQPRDLRLQPGQRLQDRFEMVAAGELVEALAQCRDLALDGMGEVAGEGRGRTLLAARAACVRRQPRAEAAQIFAQRRDALLHRLRWSFLLAVEQALARADVGDGGGEAVAAEGQPRRALAGLRAGLAGTALDLDDPVAHRLDGLGDDVGRPLLPLGGSAFAGRHPVLGLLDPARDGIEGSGRAGARLARKLLGRRGLADERVDLGA